MWFPADKFFENVNPPVNGFGESSSHRGAAILFKLKNHQDGVTLYQDDPPRNHYTFSDQQFGALEGSNTSDALSNVPNSFVVLYTDASAIETTVDLPAGSYQVQIYGRNAKPGPAMLLIDINDIPLGILTFDRDDESWEIKCLTTNPLYWSDSNRDVAKITVTFLNDSGPGGGLDGSVAWLMLVPTYSY